MADKTKTEQELFDETYISSSEICRELSVTRATVVQARRRGVLPEPILVNGGQLQLWRRTTVTQALADWKKSLGDRREVAAG